MIRFLLPTISLAVVAASCARPPSPPPAVAATEVEEKSAAALFLASRTHGESVLEKAASALIRGGRSVPASLAEACWREELPRPAVRDLCLLLWSGGGDDSALLTAALFERAPQSTVAAVALVRRLPPLRGLSTESLISILSSVRTAPAWIRARLLLRWLEENPTTDRLLAERLVDQLDFPAQPTSLDLASGFRALWRASRGKFTAAFSEYCHPSAIGDARIRCWRLVGTLADPDQIPAIAQFLRARLPVQRDASWQVFVRAYPGLALRIQKNLEEK